MRKFFAVLVLGVILSSTAAFAQFGPNPNFKDKNLIVGAHLGIGGGWYSTIGPVVNVEYGLAPQFGITGSVGFFGYSYNPVAAYTWSYTSIPVVVGVNWHIDPFKVKQLDTWIGAGLGYTFGSWSSSDPNNAYVGALGSYFGWDGRLGARYYLSDKLAIKGELGYWSLGYLRLGVDFKL